MIRSEFPASIGMIQRAQIGRHSIDRTQFEGLSLNDVFSSRVRSSFTAHSQDRAAQPPNLLFPLSGNAYLLSIIHTQDRSWIEVRAHTKNRARHTRLGWCHRNRLTSGSRRT